MKNDKTTRLLKQAAKLDHWHYQEDGKIRNPDRLCPLAVLSQEIQPYEFDNNSVQEFFETLHLSEDVGARIIRAADNALDDPEDQAVRWDMVALLKPDDDCTCND